MNGRRATYVFILCAVSCIIALPLDIPEDTIALKTDNSSVGESSKQDNVTSTEDITEMISPSRNNSEETDEEIDEENNEETSVGTSEETGEETETGEENSEETGSEGTSEEETEETSEKINEEDKTTKSPKKAEECYTSKEVYIYIDITYIPGERDEDEPIEVETPIEVVRKICCEGYDGDNCTLIEQEDPCENLVCNEDPQSRCVVVQRCLGVRTPVFVNSENILSRNCTQPKGNFLCHDEICDDGSICPGDKNKEAICFRRGCNCPQDRPSPVWLFPNGTHAQC